MHHLALKICMLLCLIKAGPCFLCAQNFKYNFRNYTTNDGLPSSEVHYVLKDSRGFMWFATDHGVARFNGYEFETFTAEDNSTLMLYEDYKKRIWFITFSGRLFYYENEKVYPYRYNDVILGKMGHIVINDIYVDSTDKVYASSISPKSFSIDSDGKFDSLFSISPGMAFRSFKTGEYSFFTYIYETFIVGGTFYYTYLSGESTTFEMESLRQKVFLRGMGSERKAIVKGTKNGGIVVFRGNNLLKILPGDRIAEKSFNSEILDVCESRNGSLIVGTLKDGVLFVNERNEVVDQYLQGLSVSSISFDNNGSLWLSTTERGIFFLASEYVHHLSDKGKLFNFKASFLRGGLPDSLLWIGTQGEFLWQYDKKDAVKKFIFPASHMMNLEYIKEGNYYRFGGYFYLDPSGMNEVFRSGKKFIILANSAGFYKMNDREFGGSASGLYELLFDKKKIVYVSRRGLRVDKIFVDHNGQVLMGNIYGLWKLEDTHPVPFDSTRPILKSRITDINEFKKKYLCLGTRGKGLLIIVNDSIYQVTTNEGLTSNNIRRIYIEGNDIWLGTNKGVSKLTISPSSESLQYSVRRMTFADGLLSNEVNDIVRYDNKIFIATNNGVSVIEEDYFQKKTNNPLPFYLQTVKINGEVQSQESNYSIDHGRRNLYFSLIALDYQNPNGIQYRYRLKGLNDDWVSFTGRELQFTALPYGDYDIELQAKREYDMWEDASTITIGIKSRPPYWQRTWFWVLSLLLISAMITLLASWRIRVIRKREEERVILNKKLAAIEMQALRAQMNPHFIFNALNSIKYFISFNKKEEAGFYLTKFSKLVRKILDSSREFFIVLSDEIELLELYMDFEKIRFEDKFDYDITVDQNVSPEKVKIPNMIIQPFVENAIKHGFRSLQNKRILKVQFEKKEDTILCIIQDNGIGRRNAAANHMNGSLEQDKSLGTVMIREKIEALKNYYNYRMDFQIIDLENEAGVAEGTKVEISFPDYLI